MILFENDLIHAYPGSTLTYEVLAINATGTHTLGTVKATTYADALEKLWDDSYTSPDCYALAKVVGA